MLPNAWHAMIAEAAPVNAELAAARRCHASQLAGMLPRGVAEQGRNADPIAIEACAQAIQRRVRGAGGVAEAAPRAARRAAGGDRDGLVRPGLSAH
jgi:hypothetical protein